MSPWRNPGFFLLRQVEIQNERIHILSVNADKVILFALSFIYTIEHRGI
jgi:hypothetical protein